MKIKWSPEAGKVVLALALFSLISSDVLLAQKQEIKPPMKKASSRGLFSSPRKAAEPAPDSPLAAKIRRFAPTVVTADASKLAPRDRQALVKIIAAARLLDPLFLRQVWSGNAAL